MKLTDKPAILVIRDSRNYTKEALEEAFEWHRELADKIEEAIERGEYLDDEED